MRLEDAIEILEDKNDLGPSGMDKRSRKRLRVKPRVSKKQPDMTDKAHDPYRGHKTSSYQEGDMNLRDRGYVIEEKLKLTPGKFAVVVTTPNGKRDVFREFGNDSDARAVMKKMLTRFHEEGKIRAKWAVSLYNVWDSGDYQVMWHRTGKQGPK